mmetsp:Transcript_33288/g.73612  ORF Transcript_33288/g.73612 Transcript_33288/m.73612 type:complete len:292 (+) Transcript_33288:1234-2109(+)
MTTASVWPCTTASTPPLATSHTRAVESLLTVTARLPLRSRYTALMPPRCTSRSPRFTSWLTHWPECRSHMETVLSYSSTATSCPTASNAVHLTRLPCWGGSTWARAPLPASQEHTLRSEEAVMKLWPLVDTARLRMAPEWPAAWCSMQPPPACHTRARPSSPDDTTRLLPGRDSSCLTLPACLSWRCRSGAWMSHTRAVWSSLAVTAKRPPKVRTTLRTLSEWPSIVVVILPVAESHMIAMPSPDTVITCVPSREMAASLIQALWPSKVQRQAPVSRFHIRAVLSSEHVTA